MTAPPVVIVACGEAKSPYPAPPADLYTGQHFRLAVAAACALAPAGRCFVLSARYGLLALDDPTRYAPYDLTIGQPGAVTSAHVAADARRLGIEAAPRVVALAPARYADLCRAVWPTVEAPLAGQGIGYQRQTLARIRDGGLTT